MFCINLRDENVIVNLYDIHLRRLISFFLGDMYMKVYKDSHIVLSFLFDHIS